METKQRLKALYDVIRPTMDAFLHFVNDSNDGKKFEQFQDLMKNDWLSETECCKDCNHQPRTCNAEICKKIEAFIKLPCKFCNRKCTKQILFAAVENLVQFHDLVHKQLFGEYCIEFSRNPDNVFEEFPMFKTWKQLWRHVDEAASNIDEFLDKKKMNDDEDRDNNKTWRHVVLIFKLDLFMDVFKTLFIGKF